MKSSLLTSALFGLVLPFIYFVFIDVVPMDIYENGILVSKANSKTGLLAFLEFYGAGKALLIYSKVALVMFLFTFSVCIANQFIRSKIETEL